MNKAALRIITALLVLAAAELFSYLSLKFVLSPKGASYIARPLGEERFRTYMAERHPVLGWPKNPVFQKDNGLNARRSLVNARFEQDCISLYGDSFTFSGEVADRHAWAEVAAARLKCKVRNFGVGGYGSDQAYLRFSLQKDRDPSKIIVLNHLSENILRNINQYRSLLYPGIADNFKPVFYIAGDDGLKLAAIPKFSGYRQYLKTVDAPARHLAHESFLPNGRNRGAALAFPYSLSLISVVANDFHIRARLNGIPWHSEFYAADHPDNGLAVTSAILQRFHADVRSLGKTPVIAITPVCADFRYFQDNGKWTYQPLIGELQNSGLEVLNFGAEILEIIGDRDPESMYDDCSGHPNEDGYRIMGDALVNYIRRH